MIENDLEKTKYFEKLCLTLGYLASGTQNYLFLPILIYGIPIWYASER
jgi:hypothetical protein